MLRTTIHILIIALAGIVLGPSRALAEPRPDAPTASSRPLGPSLVRSGPGAGPATPAESSSTPGTLRTAASLGAVLILIFICAAVFKRFVARKQGLAGAMGAAGRAPAGVLEILGRYPLGRGSSLVLLRLDRRVLLLSQSAAGGARGIIRPVAVSLSTLTELTDPDDVASILTKTRDADGESIAAKFQSLLSGFSASDDAPPLPPEPQHAASDGPQPTIVVRTPAWSNAMNGGAA